ncbi:FKBP-type peptidyl-prolyl cis-trans isomerase [Saccharolobus islandicus]|uniref:peptidylprolyl isomerase n=3 Tax=Saccharolobus islandicus TaxID=43080 RepID=M9UEN8_SACIS|nr:peptidylprolyl isomerase [Sulfolobus islandicus]ADX82677.1 peptidylprolyl isomerase FKBP-type [Sulfolobus islandicus HVE10/4]ADX85317.1 peptidylprolyl isomerase FKBP-type [Sulfolobus islandicus REY15A]AGJ62690.1 FKBP-type peptidyl-prolyl cis-trans isomerases 2 [Sulfolobus islandicus LAL14/1]WCM38505.1 peptidylprolyl isomerase [Sulfolobus islandicus]
MFKNNDFIYIEYTARIKDTGEIVDTTNEEEAKKANIYDETRTYGPRLVILGENRLIKGLEEALYNFNLNEEKTIEIPPEKAYGERDNSKIKIVPLGELRRQGITPVPNNVLRLSDGSLAVIRSVSGGRVVLDLNHPLAGRTLMYNVKVVKVLDNAKDKVMALIERRFSSKYASGFNVELDDGKKSVRIIIPKDLYLVEDLQINVYSLAYEIVSYVLADYTVEILQQYTKSTFSSS